MQGLVTLKCISFSQHCLKEKLNTVIDPEGDQGVIILKRKTNLKEKNGFSRNNIIGFGSKP